MENRSIKNLSCKVGDKVFTIMKSGDIETYIIKEINFGNYLDSFQNSTNCKILAISESKRYNYEAIFYPSDFDDIVFLSEEDAKKECRERFCNC